LVRHTALTAHPRLKSQFPVLVEAASLIGSWQIRNIGTIDGPDRISYSLKAVRGSGIRSSSRKRCGLKG
jgi:hypothetical protein